MRKSRIVWTRPPEGNERLKQHGGGPGPCRQGAERPCLRWLLLALGALLLSAGFLAGQPPLPPAAAGRMEFVPGQWNRLEELPGGRFRDQVDALPLPARDRARRWLQSFQFPAHDLASLRCDSEGGIYYVCHFEPGAETAQTSPAPSPVQPSAAPLPVSPFPDSLKFHSRPGAPNVIYLNFAGETVTNTEWNTQLGRAEIPALPFSMDADFTTYSGSEQAAIRAIWQRVAEDYAPFDVNVTTERPATFNNRTAMVLITRNTDANGLPNPASDSGGVSYVNVFGTIFYARYRPAWVYANNLGHVESYIAEAASHEAGHNLGLSHDGRTDGMEYYGGHGSGDISWGPIMGTGYNRNVSQWCKGEYYLANNTQDDLAILASKLNYRPDDHGSSPSLATALVLTGGTNVVSTTPENDPANTNRANKGILERAGDVDWFSFVTGSGPIWLTVRPWVMPSGPRGGNLDIALELYDSAGNLLLTNNPPETTAATLATQLAAGLYFVAVRNSGAGDPFSSTPTGYTAYGSLGQYFFSGWVTDPQGVAVPPMAELSVADLTDVGRSEHLLTVTYSDNVAIQANTIGNGDLWITGPNGFAQYARLVSLSDPTDGTPRTAVYGVSPPNGAVWSAAHNGTYEVWMVGQEVADTEGQWVPPGRLGQFQVAVPVLYYEARMDTDPGWTLDPLWQYGTPAYASGGPTGGATGIRIIGYNLSGTYENNLSPRYATTPPINTTGSTSLSLRFQRWLRLRRGDTAVIEVSTNGLHWQTVWSTTSQVADNSWRQVQYDLPSAVAGSSSLRIRWGLASNPSQTDLGWHLDDVQVLGRGVFDNAPPQPTLNVAPITLAGTISHLCTVQFTDETAVRLVTLDSEDLMVTGPNNYLAWAQLVGVDTPTDAAQVTATYAIPPPNGAWQSEHNGTYTILLAEGAVEDVWGHATPQTVLGTFEVNIPVMAPGTLAVWPEADWTTSGSAGGPFQPESTVYVLTNAGTSDLQFHVSSSADWLVAEPAAGSLAAGQTQEVRVGLGPSAAHLPPGIHMATITFVNATSGQGNATRQAVLQIQSNTVVVLTVAAQPSAWGRVEPSGGEFPHGSSVELYALPGPWFDFLTWTGDVVQAQNPLSLILTQNLSITAVFVARMTTNHPTPLWWLASFGYTNDFEAAVDMVGANGLPLWQSYIAGLDPTDPESRLSLQIFQDPQAATLVVRWNPQPGRLYTLWEATDLDTGFAVVPGAVDLPEGVAAWTNRWAADPTPRYYRLSVRLGPAP